MLRILKKFLTLTFFENIHFVPPSVYIIRETKNLFGLSPIIKPLF